MRKWIRPLLLAIVLTALLLPALTGQVEAETVSVSTLAELRAAVQTRHTTVKLQKDISCSSGDVVELAVEDVVLDLNGHTLTCSDTSCSVIKISADRVRVCNGKLVGKTDQTGGIDIRERVNLVELWDLDVQNTVFLLRTARQRFGTIYIQDVSFQQCGITYPCVYLRAAGRVVMNDATIESCDGENFVIENGARVLLGNVTATRRTSFRNDPLLIDLSETERTYGNYRLPASEIKTDGTICGPEKKLTTGTWDGDPAYLIKGTKLESTLIYTTEIERLSLTIPRPADGQKPRYEPAIDQGAAYMRVTGSDFFRNDIQWSDVTGSSLGTPLDPDQDTFRQGRKYEAVFYVTPEPGYQFSASTIVKVNGEAVEAHYRNDLNPKQMAVYYCYTVPKEGGSGDDPGDDPGDNPGEDDSQSGEYVINLLAGSTVLTGANNDALLVCLLDEQIESDWSDKDWIVIDLDVNNTWDLLGIKDGSRTTLYKLPTCSVKKDFVLELSDDVRAEAEMDGGKFKTVTFLISNDVKASYKIGSIADKTYTGKAQKPAPALQLVAGSRKLTIQKGADYELSWQKNVNAGTATVIFEELHPLFGTLKKAFKILPLDLSKAASKTSVSGIKASYAYTGKAIKPTPTVKALVGGATRTLKAGTDYTVKYTNNIN
ncbi:MAG: hypothetical protein IJM69_01960, partial [Firmicutes bacterium]|nr:hypothetical protein [Bacillota bacterium]